MPNNIFLTDKVRLHPDKLATDKLWQASYACKDVWNFFNNDKRENQTNYYNQKKMLPALKGEKPALKIPSSQVLQEVVKSLHAGWKMFFTKLENGDPDVKPPRFKSYKYFFTQKYPQQVTSFEFAKNILRLAYGKNKSEWIEIRFPERDYPLDTVKSVTISYDRMLKHWYVSICREIKLPEVLRSDKTIFFDPGVKTALTGIRTDKTVWEYDLNPLRELNLKHYKLIDYLKSLRDKKQKSSKRWRRINKKISKVYSKIRTQTKHYLHIIANKILSDHPGHNFRVGNWHKQKTLADTGYEFLDKRINRQVQNNNPVKRLVGYLSYKATLKGQQVNEFDERGTTRTCSCCGAIQKMPPGKRVYVCPVCDFKTERDINSVLNFLKNYDYASWQSLSDKLSIVRYMANPLSGANRRSDYRSLILNYQDARGLSTP